ncbi:MAG: alpha/beta hydrolase, partial [Nitrososphaerales archaeon]
MFGVLSEPLDRVHGPLIVLVNGINEDHVGPARLWVELSRRWAGLGLRCLRFDASELGESPRTPGLPDRPVFDETLRYDVIEVVRALNPTNPEDSVLIGLCSGAQIALEAALELRSRGLCAINPQVGTGILRSADKLRKSDRQVARSFALNFERTLKRRTWADNIVQRVLGLILLSAFSPKVRPRLVRNSSHMLLLLGPNDVSPFTRIPIIGSLLGRQLVASE